MARTVVVLTLVLAALVAGCGDGDDEAAGDVDRYCDLVQELDEAGEEVFAELEQDENATDEQFAEAERQFLESHEEDFEELRSVAPGEIADDVDVLLTAQEERASGGEQEETSDEVSAAEERTQSFEEENC